MKQVIFFVVILATLLTSCGEPQKYDEQMIIDIAEQAYKEGYEKGVTDCNQKTVVPPQLAAKKYRLKVEVALKSE